MLLWVTSFVESGYLPDDEAAKTVYTRLLLTSVGGIAIFFPITMKYIDRWNHGVMIALSFFMRSVLLIFGFPFLKTPDGFWTYFVSFWMLLFTGYQSVALESFSMKIMPSDVVGTLRGIFNFFGQIGVLMITILTGVFFDLFGPSVIFIFVGVLDIVLSILTVCLMFCGYMKVQHSSAADNSPFGATAQSQSD